MRTMSILIGAAALIAASPALAASGLAADGASLQQTAAALAPNDWVWNDAGTTGPLSIVVSLPDQRAYVYRGSTVVAVSSVSTGRDGKETPTGTFPILQKQVEHKSNLYHAAAMPYMERLTWDGVAIHAGDNPGFPDSHGCVHVPIDFAKKLYRQTRVGTKVTVIDSSIVSNDGDDLLPTDVYAAARAETAHANGAELESLGTDD